MDDNKCLLCNVNNATAENSHIIPSFLIAKVCSYNGGARRDQEVMFTITPTSDKLYLGKIPDTAIDKVLDLDNLEEERIENELKKIQLLWIISFVQIVKK